MTDQRKIGDGNLGEDCNVKSGTKVYAIADGRVNFVGVRPGISKDQRNWGGIVILGHWISEDEAFYFESGKVDYQRRTFSGTLPPQ